MAELHTAAVEVAADHKALVAELTVACLALLLLQITFMLAKWETRVRFFTAAEVLLQLAVVPIMVAEVALVEMVVLVDHRYSAERVEMPMVVEAVLDKMALNQAVAVAVGLALTAATVARAGAS